MRVESTGLVSVVDRGAKGGAVFFKQHPVDVNETFARRDVLKDGTARFVLEENYVPGDPA